MFHKELFSGSSQYGNYRVVDMRYNGRKARLLYGDDNTPQSGVALDDNPELLFDYNQRFLEMVESTRPKKLLVIGGGVFMLPKAALERFKDMEIHVVEIDQLLVDLARKYFDLPQDSRMKIFVQDGKEFIQNSLHRYDMIILDAFTAFTVPEYLIDQAAAALYRSHLTEGGCIAINFISKFTGRGRWLAHAIVGAFEAVFPEMELYQADPDYYRDEEQNLLFVAANKEMRFDYLQSHDVLEMMDR